MKFRPTVSAIAISVLAVLAIGIAVVLFGVVPKGLDRLQDMVQSWIPSGGNGIEVTMDGLSGTVMRSIRVNGIHVESEDGTILDVEKVEVSASLFDLVAIVFGGGPSQIDVNVSSFSVELNEGNIQRLISVVNSLTGSGGEGEATSPLSGIGLNLSINDVSIAVDYRGIKVISDGINAQASLDGSMNLVSAVINVPYVDATLPDGSMAKVDDIRASVDPDLRAYISVNSATYADMVDVRGISAIASLNADSVSAALHVESARLLYETAKLDLNALANGTTISATYGLSQPFSLTFGVDIPKVEAKSNSLSASVEMDKIMATGSVDSEMGLSLMLGLDSVDAIYSGLSFGASDIGADIGMNLKNSSSVGQIVLDSLDLPNSKDLGISGLEADSVSIDYSFTASDLGLRLRGNLRGKSENELVGAFSTNLDANVHLKDLKTIQSAGLNLESIKLNALPEAASLDLELDSDWNLSGSLSVADDIAIGISLDRMAESLAMNLFITDLGPFDYKAISKAFLSNQGIITDKSAVDGSFVVALNLADAFTEFIGHLHDGEYNAAFNLATVFDIVHDGRLSFNGAVRNIQLGEEALGGAFTFEASFDPSGAKIDTLALTTMGMRLSYTGGVDFVDMVPAGTIYLNKSGDGSELASMVLSHATGSKDYKFLVSSPLLENSSIFGNVDWRDISAILIDGAVVTPLLVNGRIDFNSTLYTDPFSFELKSDIGDISVRTTDLGIEASALVSNLGIALSNGSSLWIGSRIGADVDLEKGSFNVDLDDLAVNMPGIVDAMLDISISDKSLRISDVSMALGAAGKERKRYSGSLDIGYDSLSTVFKGITSTLEGRMEFVSEDGIISLSGAVTNDQYLLSFANNADSSDLSVEILGRRGEAFHVAASLGFGEGGKTNFSFNGVYHDKLFSLYDCSGNIGSLSFSDIEMLVDFDAMYMSSSVKIRNEIPFQDGSTRIQSGTILLDARVDSITRNLFQLFSGNDYTLEFNLGLEDFILDDGYMIADTDLKVTMSNNVLDFTGNMINGEINLESGYIDISIDHDLLFGFNAHGFVGEELDLYLTDIYFPFPVANQFMNAPIMEFQNGIIEGDLLVKGTLSNPSFYGMLYCQSFVLSMFFLPDQIITAKDVTLSLHDHTISISKAPISGYSESDGRSFYGDLAMEMTLQLSGQTDLDLSFNINRNTPIQFWIPIVQPSMEMEIRGDIAGMVGVSVTGGKAKLTTDIVVSSTQIDFRVEDEVPSWLNATLMQGDLAMDMDVKLTTGHDIAFYYPEEDNFFLNFTLTEDKSVHILAKDGKLSMDGGLSLKTGQVYYFQNDFIIREGSVDLTERKYSSTAEVPFVLNLTADITDYDSDGKKVVISLILQNATLDNISPRFISTPAKSENEILAMLGQSVLASGHLDKSLSLTSIAAFAATATDALTRVGVIESNKSYSITGTIRNSLGLDIFAARSRIIPNVLIDALPGDFAGRGDVSMLARYLDKTSLFAGKYIGTDWFAKIRLMLRADGSVRPNERVGSFLAKDLILDTEISLDWNTPMGTFSVFTQPRELSAFDILDTIGFSVTKQIQL